MEKEEEFYSQQEINFWIAAFFLLGMILVADFYEFNSTPKEPSLAKFVSCFDANVVGCSKTLPPSYSRCTITTTTFPKEVF